MIALTAPGRRYKQLLAAMGGLTALLAAGDPVPAAGHDPLFESHGPLHIVIDAPLSQLRGGKSEIPEVEGAVRYRSESGEYVELAVKVSTRGVSRLEYCSFPPLRLNFKRKQVRDTLFDGQNKLKLVTHCKGGVKHATWLRQEYLIYRIYNLLTEESFRVRWLNIEYWDTERKRKSRSRTAFLIEAVGRLADRLDMERVRSAKLGPQDLDGSQTSLVSLFQFMIGNTDWSALGSAGGADCCHNGRPLRQPGVQGKYVVVPYDFDQAGLIDADYAGPSPNLRIKSVRTRLFRGFCLFNEQRNDAIALFNERRPAIYALLEDPEISSRTSYTMRRYLDDYYEIINDPRTLEKEVTSQCRGPAA